jgi:hypothetical protein
MTRGVRNSRGSRPAGSTTSSVWGAATSASKQVFYHEGKGEAVKGTKK